jgi:hypothetical protein
MVSVGGVTITQINLLVRRAVRDLKPTKLGVFLYRDVTGLLRTQIEAPAGVRLFDDIKDLRRDVSVRTAEANPPRRIETIQAAIHD